MTPDSHPDVSVYLERPCPTCGETQHPEPYKQIQSATFGYLEVWHLRCCNGHAVSVTMSAAAADALRAAT